MAEDADSTLTSELQDCFNDLKKHSVSYKLGQAHQATGGDEMQNPLHKQFAIILAKIDEILVKQNKEMEDYVKLLSMKASIVYEKAKILLSENLLTESQALLEEALALIKEQANHPKIAFLHMRIVNHLTYVLSRLGHLEQAKEMLLKSIEDEETCQPEVFSTDDLFLNTKKDPKISATKLNRLTINNMQMLAWIYARLGHTELNLKIQHNILQKQLDVADGDILKWAESCYRLASMFITNSQWSNAVYHLVAAEEVLNPLEAAMVPNPEVFAAEADLARSWVYYGLQLFEVSHKKRLPKEVVAPEPSLPNDAAKQEQQEQQEQPLYTFKGLAVNVPEDIPTTEIENAHQAKSLLVQMQKWIKRARLFYTLRDYPLQYVNLCLDLSELYRFAALYEGDLDAQYAVQKRRYDALETLSNILKEVRPSCYVAVNVELTKELIEVQMELMNLNLKKLYMPPPMAKTDENEDTLRKQIGAFSSLYNKLQTIPACCEVNATERETDELDKESVEKPETKQPEEQIDI